MQTTANVTNGAGDPDPTEPVAELDTTAPNGPRFDPPAEDLELDPSPAADSDGTGERPPYVDLYTEDGAAVGGPLRWRVIGNGRKIAAGTEGYHRNAGRRHGMALTLEALLALAAGGRLELDAGTALPHLARLTELLEADR